MEDELRTAKDLILDLQEQVKSLTARIQELESSKMTEKLQSKDANEEICKLAIAPIAQKEQDYFVRNNKKTIEAGAIPGSLKNRTRRLVALKIVYFGQRFYGFASEAAMEPTVESEIFSALKRTKLLLEEPKSACYSRCGRTDKGVSAFGQVISLYLRSHYKGGDNRDLNEPFFNIQDTDEIDYVKVLNKALPNDIRVVGWCPVSADFHSRFGCLSREYKYYFFRENLDINEMKIACKKFTGDHDFRNFCKMDAQNVHTFRRKISKFDIVPLPERWAGKDVMVLQVRGTAFLWHQVRCMAAVLFLIGQGLESPNVIDDLLDTSKTVRKPQYKIASEMPLVLHLCEFEGIVFRCSSDAAKDMKLHMQQQLQFNLLKSIIYHEATCNLPTCNLPEGDDALIPKISRKTTHVPLSLRPTEPSYEERKKKFEEKANKSHSTIGS